MHGRLGANIQNWWTSNNNAVKDNGGGGIDRLNAHFSPHVSANTYYFTMSFDATRPFPQEHLSGQDLENLPMHPLVSFWGIGFPGPFNISANAAAGTANIARDIARIIPGSPSDIAYAKWVVELANNHLSALGYQIRLPSPGSRIPLADMLPALSIFSLGMSGMSRSLGLSEQNDGVVDTSSMRAPALEPVQDIHTFNSTFIPANQGVYWDLGLTEGIDHADQVGVFTDPNTVSTTMPITNVVHRRLLE
jgi:hypothetical protein